MRKFLILLTITILAVPASAQWHRAALYGADVRALITHPTEPDTLFLGTSSGEVYVSRDGAKSWSTPRRGVPFPGYIVDNLVVDREGRLWAASWGLWGGGVIAVSEDGAKTWERRDEGLEDFSVRAIAIDPNDAGFVVVGGLTGVYRSTDAGRTWEKISDQVNVESLAIDPRSRERIYVGTWRQGLRTEDGGRAWTLINNGMVLDTDMFSITIEQDDPDSVWVSTCGWVYNSANRGDKWTRYRDGFNNRRIHDIKVDPCNRDVLYAGSVAGLYRSEDRGKSWYVVSDESLVINSIALHPQRPGRIVLGVEGDGVYVSHNSAKTFARASEGLRNVRVASIVADPAVKDRVYAAVMFGGASSGVYESNDAGRTWEKRSKTQLPEVLSLVVASESDAPARFVAGTDKGFFYSADAVQWTQGAPIHAPIRVSKVLRFNRTRYFGATSDGVYTSRDGGVSWYRLAGATTRAVDIAIGFLGQQRALFALTDSGLALFDGERWRSVESAPARGRSIAIQGDVVFVAGAQGVKGGRIDEALQWVPIDTPNAQYAVVHGGDQNLFLTSRQQREILLAGARGEEWRSISLPTQHTEVTSITVDPFDRSRVYVGTLGAGVFVFQGETERYAITKKTTSEAASAGGGR